MRDGERGAHREGVVNRCERRVLGNESRIVPHIDTSGPDITERIVGEVESAVGNDASGEVVHHDGLGNGDGPLREALENIRKKVQYH